MTEAVAPAGGMVPFREVLEECRAWLKRNWKRTLIFSLVSFVIGWVWNTYLMAKKLEGSVPAPGSTTVATAQGKTGNGVYWLLVATVGFGMVTYARERGVKGFFDDLGQLPRTLSAALKRNARATWAMLLWGMALSLTISAVLSQAIAGVLGLGLLLTAASPLAVIVNNIVIRVWVGVFSTAAPAYRDELPSMANPFMMMTGEAVGMLIAYFSDDGAVKVGLAVLCAVGGYLAVVSKGKQAPSAATLILLAMAFVAGWEVLHASRALADDGGWLECVTKNGTPCSQRGWRGIFDWYHSPGAAKVLARGRVGGYFSAMGAAAGSALGGGMGVLATALRGGGPAPGAAAPATGVAPPGGAPAPAGAPTPPTPQAGPAPTPAHSGAPASSAPDVGQAHRAGAHAGAQAEPDAGGAGAPGAPSPPDAAPGRHAAAAHAGAGPTADSGVPHKGDVAASAKHVEGARSEVDLKMGVQRTDAGAAGAGGHAGGAGAGTAGTGATGAGTAGTGTTGGTAGTGTAGAAGTGTAGTGTAGTGTARAGTGGGTAGTAGAGATGGAGAPTAPGTSAASGGSTLPTKGRSVADLPAKGRSATDLPAKGRGADDLPSKGTGAVGKQVGDRPEVDLKMGVRKGGGRGAGDLPTKARSAGDLPHKGDVPAAHTGKQVGDRPEVDLKMGVRKGHGGQAQDLPTRKRSADDLGTPKKGGQVQDDVLPDEDKFRERRILRRRGKGKDRDTGDGGDERLV